MARKDPLATQVWKAYARAKGALPHGQRMMHLTMQKGGSGSGATPSTPTSVSAATVSHANQAKIHSLLPPPVPEVEESERGRRKGNSRVVGFASPRESRYVTIDLVSHLGLGYFVLSLIIMLTTRHQCDGH
jgi:GATA-binding protein